MVRLNPKASERKGGDTNDRMALRQKFDFTMKEVGLE